MLNCPKCQTTKTEQVGGIDFIPYPSVLRMKCKNEKCGLEWSEYYLMNQKVIREKDKPPVIEKVNPKNPNRNCPNCKNSHVSVTGEGDYDAESIGVKIACLNLENSKGCGLKYEENYFLDKLRDTNTGKEIKLEQKTLDEAIKPKISKSKPKAKPKPAKAAKTGNHTKKDFDKKPTKNNSVVLGASTIKPKGSISATNKYIKSGNDKLIQKRLKEREQRSKKRNKA